MTMGEKILGMRKARGWSQEELAEQAGVSRQAVSRWESGSAKPDADKIIILCDLFGISADYLLRDDYRGETVMGDEKRLEISAKERWGRYLTWGGGGSLFILVILNCVFPASVVLGTYYNKNGFLQPIQAKGMRGFLMYYNLEWLFFLALGFLILGLVLIWRENEKLRKATVRCLARIKQLFFCRRKDK